MDCKSLMIGDWVLVNGTPMQIQSIDSIDDEIYAGDELYCLVEDRVHSEDKVEPILLTAEILEKNGMKWLSTEPSGRITYISIEPPIIATWLKDHWLVSVGPAGSTKMPYVEIGWLNYVHQIQHALKLCGIDKTIEI